MHLITSQHFDITTKHFDKCFNVGPQKEEKYHETSK